jgi:hypothetical protein
VVSIPYITLQKGTAAIISDSGIETAYNSGIAGLKIVPYLLFEMAGRLIA